MNQSNTFCNQAIWRVGFRPFFLLVLACSLVPTSVWVLHFVGFYRFDFAPLTAYQWHANEMIFGFLLAAMIGFLLTATAHWTNTRGIHGKKLIFLFLLFLFTRFILWFRPFDLLWPYILISCIVPAILLIHLAKLFIQTNNKRNLILLLPLGIFILGQILIFTSKYNLAYELALYAVRFLIIVIAGRIIPFFTKSVLELDPKWTRPILEKLTILSGFLLILEPYYKYQKGFGEYLWIGLTILAFLLNSYRLINWRFIPSFKVKVLFILHIAYLWLPIHFALNIANYFGFTNDFGKASLHSLAYGCMGIMILGIMHRVTLGHTGRVIKAATPSLIAYVLIFLGAILRVFAPLMDASHYLLWLKLSGLAWFIAFILLALEIVPMLVSERADGKEY